MMTLHGSFNLKNDCTNFSVGLPLSIILKNAVGRKKRNIDNYTKKQNIYVLIWSDLVKFQRQQKKKPLQYEQFNQCLLYIFYVKFRHLHRNTEITG